MDNLSRFESDLWEAADNLRANSKLTSSDYFVPVRGVIFLRHAATRFDAANQQIAADQATGKMPHRKVQPADYIRRRALWLPVPARYDYIMEKATIDPAGLPKLATEAMTAIEADFEPLLVVLPKDYGIFEPKVLEDLMRLFNSEQIKRATGEVFWVGLWERYVESQTDYRAGSETLARKLAESGTDAWQLLAWLRQPAQTEWAAGEQAQLLARVFAEQFEIQAGKAAPAAQEKIAVVASGATVAPALGVPPEANSTQAQATTSHPIPSPTEDAPRVVAAAPAVSGPPRWLPRPRWMAP